MEDGQLFETERSVQQAQLFSNLPALPALTAWRRYGEGPVVEQRIEQPAQLGAGRTAVENLGENALLWQMAALPYQLLHVFRTRSLKGSWRTAQPNRLRSWLFRLPAQLTRHAREQCVQAPRGEPVRLALLEALRRVGRIRAPPGLTTACPTTGLNPILKTGQLGSRGTSFQASKIPARTPPARVLHGPFGAGTVLDVCVQGLIVAE